MNALSIYVFDTSVNAFSGSLSLQDVPLRAPAVFVRSGHRRADPKYRFIPTERVPSGLKNAGFQVHRFVHRRSLITQILKHINRSLPRTSAGNALLSVAGTA